ncbi:type II secretory pathway, component HofQ [Sulfuricella denitrificans skB26]|uniref:Type II secretory pathway, component HofQ n=1 Tax=Sulfuricella denitrificans (strain DSM 22764 / NBRC 105220 / skB26) TaxID=1163617 RepID=S6ADN8_SULDS|nr:secretin N-terminal domain-containing protein [Sulfuricella denitrificans]BAN36613.1 type II secretory pathway, component HofQ [Sulfuricella denitrificans skB26]
MKHWIWRLALLLLISFLAGCAGERAFREGKSLLAEGRTEEGLTQLEIAVKEDPNSIEFRTQLYRQRQLHIQKLLTQGDNARNSGHFVEAESWYLQALKFEDGNTRATNGLQAIEGGRRRAAMLTKAENLFKSGDLAAAEKLASGILGEDPANLGAREIKRKIDEKTWQDSNPSSGLSSGFKKPITIEFRDVNLKTIFEVISRTAGINFVFDKDVKPDLKATIMVRNSSVEDVINMLLVTNQLQKSVLNNNTILIYPHTPAKVKDYQELVVKGFYLTNADPKQMMSEIKTVLKTRDISIDESLNMLVMRDTPNVIRLAEKLVALHDRAEPEVVLEVEILEVKRSKLTELGMQWPNKFTVVAPPLSTTTATAFGNITNSTLNGGQLTVDNLRHLNGAQIGIPNPVLNLRGEDSDTNLLANPRIRVRNREKAKIHIGDRVPVITTTATANVGVAESVTYLDVGLKLEVEPRIYLDNDVAMKVNLEVSNIVQQIKSSTGTLTYQLGTRNASTTLRLKDGETQALAGLINDEDRASANKVPGLGDIPVLGHLFSSRLNSGSKTEIVLLITPRIVKNLIQPDAAAIEFTSGTETFVGAPPLAIRPVDAFSVLPGQRPAAQPQLIQRSETAPVPQSISAPPALEPQPSSTAIPPSETTSPATELMPVPAAEGKFRED